jgi:hypothetical protein
MADPAVFQGSLVDLKNVGTHKSVRLIIEVPEEYGEAIVRAFGWPTRVKPVSVAVARLERDAPKRETEPVASQRRFEDLSPAQQAGILCREPDFAEFIKSEIPGCANMHVAEAVKIYCGVHSRADIKYGTAAHGSWGFLLGEYRRWQDERNRLDVAF